MRIKSKYLSSKVFEYGGPYKDLARQVVEYDAFTDIEFNPQKSVNCQARAVALFVSLCRRELLQRVLDDP